MYNKGGKKGEKILSDDDRESVFSDYIDRLMNEMESKKDGREGPVKPKDYGRETNEIPSKSSRGTIVKDNIISLLESSDGDGQLLSMESGDELDNGMTDTEKSDIDSDAPH